MIINRMYPLNQRRRGAKARGLICKLMHTQITGILKDISIPMYDICREYIYSLFKNFFC